MRIMRGLIGKLGATVFQINGQPTAQNTASVALTASSWPSVTGGTPVTFRKETRHGHTSRTVVD